MKVDRITIYSDPNCIGNTIDVGICINNDLSNLIDVLAYSSVSYEYGRYIDEMWLYTSNDYLMLQLIHQLSADHSDKAMVGYIYNMISHYGPLDERNLRRLRHKLDTFIGLDDIPNHKPVKSSNQEMIHELSHFIDFDSMGVVSFDDTTRFIGSMVLCNLFDKTMCSIDYDEQMSDEAALLLNKLGDSVIDFIAGRIVKKVRQFKP